MSLGFGAILVPNWFSFVFTYKGGNQAKQGFFNAIVLVMETGFAGMSIPSFPLKTKGLHHSPKREENQSK